MPRFRCFCSWAAALALMAWGLGVVPARAGDILRRGTASGSGNATGASASGLTVPSTAPANLAASDLLRRATAALQAVQAMQTAAAAAAGGQVNLGINPNQPSETLPPVPDGLQASGGTGPGLRVSAGANGTAALWVGAEAPTQQTSSAAGGATQYAITVTQTQQQALLQWQSFDIGSNTTLNFDQSAGGADAGQWVAFNFVRDPSGRPSQILGSITAAGQVYVLDANGIIFGGSSQVNTGALVASSLPINSNLIQRGLLNNPDDQFLFSAISLPAGSNGPTPAFNPATATADVAPAQTPYDPGGSGLTGNQYAYGAVTVQAGAQLTAPSTDFVGGKVALVGPNVTNQGTINTPDGQTILAAGLEVGWVAHEESDPSLRGLDVYVGEIADSNLPNQGPAGTATNDVNALIDAPRADITLAGATVNQEGTIYSETSVSYNGRIDLLADYGAVTSGGAISEPPFFIRNTGTVNLGSASLTEILPEWNDPTTIVGATFSNLALPSQVDIQGLTVTLAGASGPYPGATLLVPNAGAGAAPDAIAGISGIAWTPGVTIEAGDWRFTAGGVNSATGVAESDTGEKFIYDNGTINMGAGAQLDVSGSQDVAASVADNVVAVQLLGSQLADSPVQRNGPLRGQTIYVDITQTGTYDGTAWVGTPLADTSGYVGLIQHTVGQLTTDGGTVSLDAGAAVNLAAGSRIDVSGGWIDYAGAEVATTNLITSAGQIVNIADATPNLVYEGIYSPSSTSTDEKWGVTSTNVNGLPLQTYEPGYVEGGNAGTLSIAAASMTLNGTLAGQSFSGARQVNPIVPAASVPSNYDARLWNFDSQPQTGGLSLTFQEQYLVHGSSNSYDEDSPAAPDIFILVPGSAAPPDANPNPTLVLPSSLVDTADPNYAGFGHLTVNDGGDGDTVNVNGNLIVPPALLYGRIFDDAPSLQLATGGSLVLAAGDIAVNGNISAPSGQINLTAYDFSPVTNFAPLSAAALPSYDPNRGSVTLAAGARLSTAGSITDELAESSADTSGLVAQSGGSIAIAASQVTVAPGATLDVDGGAIIGSTGEVTYGAAGALSLSAGQTPGTSYLLGGMLTFDVAAEGAANPAGQPLQGYSGGAGGKLSLTAPIVVVGTPGGPLPADALVLPAQFLSEGGFASVGLKGYGAVQTDAGGSPIEIGGEIQYYPAVIVASGTAILPEVQQLQVTPDTSGFQTRVISPYAYVQAPFSLTLAGSSVQDPAVPGPPGLLGRGDVVVGAGALIETSANANSAVTLSAPTVAVLGAIVAPGGKISIQGGDDSSSLFTTATAQALPTVDLGPQSVLSTAGQTVLTADPTGVAPGAAGYVRTGSVLNGGSISINGNIVVEAGAVLDVSGWSDGNDVAGLLNLNPALSGGSAAVSTSSPLAFALTPTLVASNGGSVTLSGGQELFVDPGASIRGGSGGTGAVGGMLSLSSGTVLPEPPQFPTLQVSQAGTPLSATFYEGNGNAIGSVVEDVQGNPLTSMGYFGANTFAASGFANLALQGTVSFEGAVALSAPQSLTVATGGVILATDAVDLSAPYVALGQAYEPPLPASEQLPPFTFEAKAVTIPPSYGTGILNVTAGSPMTAGLVDIGNLSLLGIGQTNVTSTNGDIRGFGDFDIAGSLTLTAGQVYAPTDEIFTIAAYASTPGGASAPLANTGVVTLAPSGSRQPPLSAGATVNIYAPMIHQNGVLEAPFGVINLGVSGNVIDPVTGAAYPASRLVTLGSGSTTSVAGAVTNSATGQVIPIPYGLILNETDWIDPLGDDISSSGAPAKSVSLTATTINVATGSTVNTSGGGDLYAYEFVPGTGGDSDVLASGTASFAVIPGYAPSFAPLAAFNTAPATITSVTNYNTGGDAGYASGGLGVGEQIYINLQNGAGPQVYTLLPARYALLPGAYLVTPEAGSVETSVPAGQPDGSFVVSGYAFNGFDPSHPLYSEFEVATGTAPNSAASALSATTVLRNRAEYSDFLASSYFGAGGPSPAAGTLAIPADGGQLDVSDTTDLVLAGAVITSPAPGGTGGLVDISTPEDITIDDSGSGSAPNTLYLSSAALTNFGAGTLVIGGTVGTETGGSYALDSTVGNVTLANDASAPLSGSDILLVATGNVTVEPGAVITASSSAAGFSAPVFQVSDSLQLQPSAGGHVYDVARANEPLVFPSGLPPGVSITSDVPVVVSNASGTATTVAAGSAITSSQLVAGDTLTFSAAGTMAVKGSSSSALAVSIGDGALLRVSADASAATTRTAVTGLALSGSQQATVTVGAGAALTGASVSVDSTNLTQIASSAELGGAISLSSGQISLVLDPTLAGAASGSAPNSLILSGSALANLQTEATALALLSYSSIDIYGSGAIGNAGYSSLALHAGEIRGFDLGPSGQVTLSAGTVTLDNSANAFDPGPASGSSAGGTFLVNAGIVSFGSNTLAVDQFAGVQLNATSGAIAQGTVGSMGALTVSGNLTLKAPELATAGGVDEAISAGGALDLEPEPGTVGIVGGPGGHLALTGASVTANGNVSLPGGVLSVVADGPGNGAGVSVGGQLNVDGYGQNFDGASSYANAGSILLSSENGNVTVGAGGFLGAAAAAGGGNAGILTVSAPNGTFTVVSATVSDSGNPAPTLDAGAPAGTGGSFSLNVANLSDLRGNATEALSPLEGLLASGNFTQAQSIRVETGDVTIDGLVKAATFSVSADKGGITVTGMVDASGATGGAIELDASGSVTLASGAELSVRGQNFNDAGQGGTVTLDAGAYTGGPVVASTQTRQADGTFGTGSAVVDISAGSIVDLSVVNDHPLELNPGGSEVGQVPAGSIGVPAQVGVYFPNGTPGSDHIAFTSSGTIAQAGGTGISFAASATQPYTTTLAPGSTVTLATAGTMAYAGGTGGSIPLALPSRLGNGAPLALTTTNVTDLSAFDSIGSLRLVAAQVVDGSGNPIDVNIDPIAGTLYNGPGGFYGGVDALNAEANLSLVAEGLAVFDLTPSGSATSGTNVEITAEVQNAVQNNGALFAGGLLYNADQGTTTPVAGNTAAIVSALSGGNANLASMMAVRPGAQLVNRTGSLTLDTTWDFTAGAEYTGDSNFNTDGNPALASNWDLSQMSYRFGPGLNQPGYLTLRAQGNVVLGYDPEAQTYGSLNDEFGDSGDGVLADNLMLPAGALSWSFQLVAGADLAAADVRQVVAAAAQPGSVLIGAGAPSSPLTSQSPTTSFETIRTGTGSIGIYAAGNVELLNNLGTIYTAGTQTVTPNNFDIPVTAAGNYAAQYSYDGGAVTIQALGSIEHLSPTGAIDSSLELPSNWLFRRGWVDPTTGQFGIPDLAGGVNSTSWWTDYQAFYEGVGSFGGGNVVLTAVDGSIVNVDAVVPTSEFTTYQMSSGSTIDLLAADQSTVQLGGGDLTVSAGANISGGVYYVEQGQAALSAGGGILTNAARTTLNPANFPNAATSNPNSWLPTILFVGQADVTVEATGNLLLGPMVNPFLLPQAASNGLYDKDYFSTYATSDVISVSSLAGSVTLKADPDAGGSDSGSLYEWYTNYDLSSVLGSPSISGQPWLKTVETNLVPFEALFGLQPASLYVTSFSSDINVVGQLTLSPAPLGELALRAEGSVNGVQPNDVQPSTLEVEWGTAEINLSDASPASIPSLTNPLSFGFAALNTGAADQTAWQSTPYTQLETLDSDFAESGSTQGNYAVLQTLEALNAPGLLHGGDSQPAEVYAVNGSISGLTLFSAKATQVLAGKDITDIGLYLQNERSTDLSLVVAGRDLIAYDINSPLRAEAQTSGNSLLISSGNVAGGAPNSGDIQISGPGTLEVLVGGNIDLGIPQTVSTDGTSLGVTSIGNTRNPYLPFGGAEIIMAAGLTGVNTVSGSAAGLNDSDADFSSFISQYVDPSAAGASAARYLPELAEMLGVTVPDGSTPGQIWTALMAPYAGQPAAAQMQYEDELALDVFYLVLRDAGRDRNDPTSVDYGTYIEGDQAIQTLFPGSPIATGAPAGPWSGSITLATRLIETTNGGDIDLLAPGGEVLVGRSSDPQKPNQGILTEDGGNISIFAQNDVDVGTSRIFTLHGGNEVIWSTLGSIAAGSGSKTVHSAPPSRVLIDPQSADVQNDLAGLATGAGIGVLATLTNVAPGSVDLIAPVGTVDAGDAGIRASGSINIAAAHVLNAQNIQAGGATSGVPVVATPNIAVLASATSTAAGAATSAQQVANEQQNQAETAAILPSIISVEVVGYGGGDGGD